MDIKFLTFRGCLPAPIIEPTCCIFSILMFFNLATCLTYIERMLWRNSKLNIGHFDVFRMQDETLLASVKASC